MKKVKNIITKGLVLTAVAGAGYMLLSENTIMNAYAGIVDSNFDQYKDDTKADFIKNKILSKISQYETTVVFTTDEISKWTLEYNDLYTYFNEMMYEHPEIFYIGQTFSSNISDGTYELYLGYIYSKEEMLIKKSELEIKINSLIENVSKYDDLKKVYEIYDYVREISSYSQIGIIEPDFNQCADLSEKYELIKTNSKYYESHSIYGALITGNTVCEGYSKALMLLFNAAGLDAGMVTNDDHGWNYVKVNGEYYQLDLTYDDEKDENTSTPYMNFFVSTDMMNTIHPWTSFAPSCTDTTFDNLFRKVSKDEIVGNNVVRIEDKLYSLEDNSIYSYNLDTTNKELVTNLKVDSTTTIKMKAYKNDLYYVSYKYNGISYECSIKKYNTTNGEIKELVNLNTDLGYDDSNLTVANFYIKNNKLFVIYLDETKSFDLTYNDEVITPPLEDDTKEEADKEQALIESATTLVEKAEISNNKQDLEEAQLAIDNLKDGIVKTNLQTRLDVVRQAISDIEETESQKALITEATALVEKAESSKVQSDVDTAQDVINKITDLTVKSQLQTRLDEVKQVIYDQTEAEKLQALIESSKKSVIKAESSLSQADVKSAQILINLLPAGTTKDELQSRLSVVIKMIEENNQLLIDEANKLVEKAESSKLKEDIKNAQNSISSLPAGSERTKLQKRLNLLVKEIAEKEEAEKLQVLIETATTLVEKAEKSKSQADIDKAQSSIYALPYSTLKIELQNRLSNITVGNGGTSTGDDSSSSDSDSNEDSTYLYYEAIAKVELFEEKLTLSTYESALKAVNKLEDSFKKTRLLKRIENAKAELDNIASGNGGTDDSESMGTPGGTIVQGQPHWFYYKNSWYYLNEYNVAVTGWLNDKSTWYYLNANGIMQTGWLKSNNKWYYLNNSGAMQTGWTKLGGNWYYLNSSGSMQTGWLNDKGTWYYLYSNGSMAKNTTINGYALNNSGALI